MALQTKSGLFIALCGSNDVELLSDSFFWSLRRFEGGLVQIATDHDQDKPMFLHPTATVDSTPVFFVLKIHMLPMIDISPLLAVDPQREEDSECRLVCQQQILDAAQDVGAFYVVGMPQTMSSGADAVLQAASAAFDKRNFSKFTLASSTGLVKLNFSPPVYEPIVPPRWLGVSYDVLRNYFTEATRVTETIIRVLSDGELQTSDTYSLLRLVCYPPSCTTGEYLETHTDKSWFTVLKATSLAGLQFLDCDGETYFDVVDAPNAFLINVGDALQMFSGGQLISRPHRATNTDPTRNRVSLPLFVEPRSEWPGQLAPVSVVNIPIN